MVEIGLIDAGRRECWSSLGRFPRLEDDDAAKIRAELPFGPLSLDEAEDHAERFKVHPLTVLNIAAGRSYCRVKACPEGHPLRLALNAKAAADQRIRYKAQKHRKSVGDAQGWACAICAVDVSGKGKAQLDHIIPIKLGGTSERDNLQILCRRCNIRKGSHKPSLELDAYMERKLERDKREAQVTRLREAAIERLESADTCTEMEAIMLEGMMSLGMDYWALHERFAEKARSMPDWIGSEWARQECCYGGPCDDCPMGY